LNNYKRGRNAEYVIKQKFEKEGYVVIRSAGSHGPADLIAARDHEIILIQVKTNGYLSKAEKEKLKEWAKHFGGKPVVAKKKGRRWVFLPL